MIWLYDSAVHLSPTMLKELKRIIEDSEIMK